MLKAQLTRRSERFDQEVAALPWIAEHSSSMERVAEKAARESQELKIIEYMESAVGQTFSAVVSGVATYGLYVRLENTAEGLVPLKNLGNEYFSFDPSLHRLLGQDTGAVYRLGQRLPVASVYAAAAHSVRQPDRQHPCDEPGDQRRAGQPDQEQPRKSPNGDFSVRSAYRPHRRLRSCHRTDLQRRTSDSRP